MLRLIINADDFGLSRSVNDAVFDLAEIGTISSTSVMANMPYASEIIGLIKKNLIGVGLHVNLTQGFPLSPHNEITSIVDQDGGFYSKPVLLSKISSGHVKYEHIKKEVFAQYTHLKELTISNIDHFDSHQGSTRIKMVANALIEIEEKEHRRFGMRCHNKFYLVNSKSNSFILEPTFGTLQHFGLRRVFVEFLLRRNRTRWQKIFKCPGGMLQSRSHNTVDLISQLLKYQFNHDPCTAPLEISCHPAKEFQDLKDTSLLEDRVNEYEKLKSLDVQQALSRACSLLRFSDI